MLIAAGIWRLPQTRGLRVDSTLGIIANLISFEKMYKTLTTPISPGEIRISEIEWNEANERRKDFTSKEKKKTKNALSFIMQNLPEKVWFRGNDFCALIYVR